MFERQFSAMLTSPVLRNVRRAAYRAKRRLHRHPCRVEFFCQIDDPYAPLAITCLKRLADGYGVAVDWYLVPPPDAAAAPQREKLAAYAARDAARIAAALGLGDGNPRAAPTPAQITLAERIAAAALRAPDPAPRLIAIANALAEEDADTALAALAANLGEAPAQPLLAQGKAQRARRGHYLGSVTWYEGECYWGVDRLHYLEARLAAEQEVRPMIAPVLDPGAYPSAPPMVPVAPSIDFFLSFRSPYSLIAAERIGALAQAYGARVVLRPVLPMVMRGLPVPRAKRLYILFDTKREADRHGIGFGTIRDPLGAGVERGLAVLHHAIGKGRGLDFAIGFLRAAFAQGRDMTRDDALFVVAAQAGISAEDARGAIADPAWRAAAEANRAALFEMGLWGVPCFQVDDRAPHWGQDRLWMVEDDLRETLGLGRIDRRRG